MHHMDLRNVCTGRERIFIHAKSIRAGLVRTVLSKISFIRSNDTSAEDNTYLKVPIQPNMFPSWGSPDMGRVVTNGVFAT